MSRVITLAQFVQLMGDIIRADYTIKIDLGGEGEEKMLYAIGHKNIDVGKMSTSYGFTIQHKKFKEN